MKEAVSHPLAGSREVPGCGNRLILDEGTWQASRLELGHRAHLRMFLVRLLDEEPLQRFFDSGLLGSVLPVHHLLSEKPLKVIGESDVHHGKSCRHGLGTTI